MDPNGVLLEFTYQTRDLDADDASRDPVQGIHALNAELLSYRSELAAKPQIIVLTKSDLRPDPQRVAAVRRYAAASGQPCYSISAVTGEGVQALIGKVSARLDALQHDEPFAEA